jgi:hypothetical protein
MRFCCDPDCPPCPGDSGGGQLSAEELAAELAGSVSAGMYDELVQFVADLISALPDDDESAAYWQAVYEALTE